MDVLKGYLDRQDVPERLVSAGCVVSNADCGRFALAFATGSSPAVSYYVCEANHAGSAEPHIISGGLSHDEKMLTGGEARTSRGLVKFVQLP